MTMKTDRFAVYEMNEQAAIEILYKARGYVTGEGNHRFKMAGFRWSIEYFKPENRPDGYVETMFDDDPDAELLTLIDYTDEEKFFYSSTDLVGVAADGLKVIISADGAELSYNDPEDEIKFLGRLVKLKYHKIDEATDAVAAAYGDDAATLFKIEYS